jgi:hypothetical protein
MRQFLIATEEQHAYGPTSVFLGGTINGSNWRELLKPLLKTSYFDPVVKDWTPEDQRREEQAKAACGIQLYVITPKMKGFFSIAEMTVAALQAASTGKKVVICGLTEDGGDRFDNHQNDSMTAIENLLVSFPNVEIAETLEVAAQICNAAIEPAQGQ